MLERFLGWWKRLTSKPEPVNRRRRLSSPAIMAPRVRCRHRFSVPEIVVEAPPPLRAPAARFGAARTPVEDWYPSGCR